MIWWSVIVGNCQSVLVNLGQFQSIYSKICPEVIKQWWQSWQNSLLRLGRRGFEPQQLSKKKDEFLLL